MECLLGVDSVGVKTTAFRRAAGRARFIIFFCASIPFAPLYAIANSCADTFRALETQLSDREEISTLLKTLGKTATPSEKEVLAALKAKDYPELRRQISAQIKSSLIVKNTKIHNNIPFLVPSPGVYQSSSWLWDSGFSGRILNRVADLETDPQNQAALRKLGRGNFVRAYSEQISSGAERGMTQHMIFDGGVDEKLWLHPRHSSISQPPVNPSLMSPAELEELYPQAAAELRWWLRRRTHNDLPYVVHPWESGRDAAREFDSQLKPWMSSGDSENLRFQTLNPGTKDPVTKRARFELLTELQKNASAGSAEIPFQVQTPDMAAHMIVSLNALEEHALRIGRLDDAKSFHQEAQRLRNAVNREMWDQESGFYYALGKKSSTAPISEGGSVRTPASAEMEKIRVRSIASLMTLYAEIPNQQQAMKLLESLESGGDFSTAWPVPSLSKLDPAFRADDYWRGSTWINTNYMIVQGLRKYGERARALGDLKTAKRFLIKAQEIAEKSIEMTSKGFYEFYSSAGPQAPGALSGPSDFSWSGLSLLMVDELDSIRNLMPK